MKPPLDKLLNSHEETLKSINPITLTPPRSTPSPSLSNTKRRKSTKRKRSIVSKEEYEIEKIVGYHRDKRNKMWYRVKWKGFSSKYNTFEVIENLTGCNFLLMKYFELEKPSMEEIKKKTLEIGKSLETNEWYKKLSGNGYKAKDLESFSTNCMDISKIFDPNEIDNFWKTLKKEFKYVIRCLIGMYNHQDPGLFRRAQNFKICLNLISLRRKQLARNAEAENSINQLEKTPIIIENTVDFECFPTDLTYVVDFKYGENVYVPQDPLLGCNCSLECNYKSKCCGKMAGFSFAYTPSGKYKFPRRTPIYECNRRCKCDKTCPNRVVQNGRKMKLCIFKTKTYGWGVKAVQKITKGEFVCEYLGELIPDSEAVVRDIEYFKDNVSYLFDLDFYQKFDSSILYCIDGTKFGNVGRFINHSCDPNLLVCPVWINCLEPNLHRLAFFAKRDIKEGEELFIDYENASESEPDNETSEDDKKNFKVRNIARIRCQCNSANCREWVFGS